MTRKDAADLLDLVVERAPKLRAAGITRVALGELELELSPHEAEADDRADTDDPDDQPRGLFDDPATYGITNPKAPVPGRNRQRAAR